MARTKEVEKRTVEKEEGKEVVNENVLKENSGHLTLKEE